MVQLSALMWNVVPGVDRHSVGQEQVFFGIILRFTIWLIVLFCFAWDSQHVSFVGVLVCL